MTLTFAIADLHGRADLLDAALASIETRAASGTVVFLGDYVDRGPNSREIISRLLAGPQGPWKWLCLRGNHEELMFRGLTPSHVRFIEHGLWMANGGDATLGSYGGDWQSVPNAHIEWLKKLPLMHIDMHRVYVHAAVDPTRALHRQTESTVLWDLYSDSDEGGHGDFHVVHGHHQFVDGPLLKKCRTNLDTFAWASGRLVVGVFDDDLPGGPVELIEVIGNPTLADNGATELPTE
ncbi:serine/threonine protein phosphatase [Azorhizobium oxalatiphilum]|uniref:Serine/threonine protein phosphatase n=1 Tax=Azorhizobium oxalatiphilum TaxID=980631 RepID=A0A917FFW9_9HYPH|nr:metallophosphoesterase [Azorhizobium oxalatiphilum]GGF75363.1 serine/threonine protein phosphatase [Azorhizobium oxalatiphilum]